MSWSMFRPVYASKEEETEKNYVSLARAVLKQGTAGEPVGTMILSIEQSSFSNLLKSYTGFEDEAFVCIRDGEMLLSTNQQNLISREQLKEVYRQVADQAYGNQKQRLGEEEYLISYYTIPEPWLFDNEL